MKIGLFSDGLPELSFEAMLDWLVAERIESVEIATGGFSGAFHSDLEKLVNDQGARDAFKDAIESRGLMLSALNCNGNPIDANPSRREAHAGDLRSSILAASKLGLDTVVAMSGCPGDLQGGTYPNCVTATHQDEFPELLERQWDEVISPFWREIGMLASDHGVKIAIEMHPGMSVYNTLGMRRLRDVAGSSVGANLDPSHLPSQGIDPLAVISALGKDFIFHVHAKDCRIDPQQMALNGGMDTRPMEDLGVRSWDYRTVGFGHDAGWWRDFVSLLRIVGYDGALSIEHEDLIMGAHEGIRKSVEFLEPIILRTPSEGKIWEGRGKK